VYHFMGMAAFREPDKLRNALQTVIIKPDGEVDVSTGWKLSEGSGGLIPHPTNPGEALVINDGPYKDPRNEDEETTLTVVHVGADGAIKHREDYKQLSAATLSVALGNPMVSPDGKNLMVWHRATGNYA